MRLHLQLTLASWPTPALDDLIAIGVIVVGQLLVRLDVACGANPDVSANDLTVAIRPARVVDETCDVSAHLCITDPSPVDGEAPDLTSLQVSGLAFQALAMVDQLAVVRDDPRVLVDGLQRENAPSVHARTSSDDSGQLKILRHVHNRIARVWSFESPLARITIIIGST